MRPFVATTLTSLTFGVVWILLSDKVVAVVFQAPASISWIQSIKGLAFVGLSTLLIFQVSREPYQRELQREREKEQIYAHTMQAVQHVLRNFLDQMQVVTIAELSRLEDLSPEALSSFMAAKLERSRTASSA